MKSLIIEFTDGTIHEVRIAKRAYTNDAGTVLHVARAVTSYDQTVESFPLANVKRYYWKD